MPIIVQWDDDEKTTLLLKYSSPWTWNEVRNAVTEAGEFAGNVTHEVYVINDLSEAKSTPDGALAQFRGISSQVQPNVGLIIVAGGSTLGNTMINLFRQVYGERARNWRTAKSVEEARALIAERRSVR